jgi:hypothetical protein
MTRIAKNSSASDERILLWLRMRLRFSANRVAKSLGVNSGIVINATKDVALADHAESGEDVRAAYPWAFK